MKRFIVFALLLMGTLPLLAQDNTTRKTLGDFTVNTNELGRATFTMSDVGDTQWVQVWIGTEAFTTVHLKWYELAKHATCADNTCELSSHAFPEIGNYVTYIQPWSPTTGFVENDISGWFGPESLSVLVSPPKPSGEFSVTTDNGQAIVTLNNVSSTEWVQIWLGTNDLTTLHTAWYELAEDASCEGETCVIQTGQYPGFGEFQAYIRPWAQIGFINNDLSGWFGPQNFAITTPPPDAPTGLSANGNTLSWAHNPDAQWYHIWVGTITPARTYYFQWKNAADLNCSSGTCTVTINGTLPYAETLDWYVESWGIGGYSINGTIAGWAQGPRFTIGTIEFAFGGQVDAFQSTSKMHRAGMEWAKQQISFSYGTNLDLATYRITDTQNKGFKVMLGIVGDENQLAANPSQYIAAYAAFVGQVAAIMPNGSAIEVWNEPNIDREWPNGMISGALYTDMLRAAYIAIKQSNPTIMVISAAPAPTGAVIPGAVVQDDIFIAQMKAAGAESYMDCVGVHYNEGMVPPSATTGDLRNNNVHHSRYFPKMIELYSSTFPSKPLCFTEIGYLTGEDIGGLPPSVSWWAGHNTLEEHAQWITEAAILSRDNPKVAMMIIWNVDFRYTGDDPMVGWSIVRPSGACPACDRLEALYVP